jgi:hypothetical protein
MVQGGLNEYQPDGHEREVQDAFSGSVSCKSANRLFDCFYHSVPLVSHQGNGKEVIFLRFKKVFSGVGGSFLKSTQPKTKRRQVYE